MQLTIKRYVASSNLVKIPALSTNEPHMGYELLIDSRVDTYCAGPHTYIIELITGMSVSYRGFSDNLPIEEDLPILNVLYAYDCKNRR